MAETAVNSALAAGVKIGVERVPNMTNASYVNSFRISAIADRLAMHVCAQPKNDPQEFIHLCLSLARGIDFSIANVEVPSRAQGLPLLVKQVCRRNYDSVLLAAVMVLMISVKNACQSGWFTEKDTQELCDLANELSSSFCTALDFKTEPSSSVAIISTIMSRFYPRLKMGQIISFLEVKPGFGTYIVDFQITKNMNHSQGEKVRLFVAQIDNPETSLCLITPPQANFLLNGIGVAMRTNVSTDSGPQLPTLVSHMLKFGTNLLQAVGQFNRNYIIAVAYMSEISTPVQATLPDYEQPPVSSVDPDSEIIEGPSRISLNCPISFRRIKTPVKGRSCKHLQCFDFDNYVDMNSRRPSWRCPHCNQHVCFTDIHMDQDMVKVLKEVSGDVTDVMISSDGSWKAIMESDDHTEPRDKIPDFAQDSPRQGSDGLLNGPDCVMDLTGIDDEMNPMDITETEDTKTIPTISHIQSSLQNATVNNSSEINQTAASHTDEFWPRIYLSSIGEGASSSWSTLQSSIASESARTILLQQPILTDSISPALNSERNALIPPSVLESGLSSSNMPQLLQLRSGNSAISNEYGRFSSASRQVNRTPVALQGGLPAMHTPVPLQRQQSTTNPVPHNGPSAATRCFSVLNSSEGQRYSLANLDPHQRPVAPRQPSQQVVGQQTPMSQTQGLTQSSNRPSVASYTGVQIHRGSSQFAGTQATGLASRLHPRVCATQQTTQVVRPVQTPRTASQLPGQTPRTASPLPGNADGFRTPTARDQTGSMEGTTPVTRTDNSMDSQPDPNWRPTGRICGSLQGEADSEALRQLLQPAQQAQASRPSIPPNLTQQRLRLLLSNRAAQDTQVNYPSTTPGLSNRVAQDTQVNYPSTTPGAPEAYSEALGQLLQPAQQAQASRPSIPPNLTQQRLRLLLSNRAAQDTQVNYPSTTSGAPDISGVLPEPSSRMQ